MNKKGFTLIELLGVIVILSLLMALSMPKIINSVKKSNSKIDSSTYDLIKSAADNYIGDNKSDFRKIPGNTFCIPVSDLVNSGYLKGPVVLSESDLDISETKSVKVLYRDGFNYEVVDSSQCTPIQVYTPVDSETATYRTDNSGLTIGNIPEGKFKPGDEYIIYVNDTNVFHFYILSDNEDGTVNLIANRDLNSVGNLDGDFRYYWYSSTADNSYGPVTAYQFLSDKTSSWINVPIIKSFYYEDDFVSKGYGYNSIEVSKVDSDYLTIIIAANGDENTYNNLRTRLPKLSEVSAAGCSDVQPSCPLYLVDYLREYEEIQGTHNIYSVVGYWLIDSLSSSDAAAGVNFAGDIPSGPHTNSNSHFGIRPVITVPKDYLK